MAVASLIGGAALGAVFGEVFNVLHDTVKSFGSDALMFKPILKSLKFNLDHIDPVVKEITRLNEMLNHREEETKSLIEDMRKAKELIHRLGNQELDYPSQASFGKELAELNESIVTFFQLHIPAQNRRDILQILEKQNFLCKRMESLVIKSGATCVVPPPPDFTVGMDQPLMVLKTQLLNEKRQQILLTAPGGCGKTTLVKMLGHDQEIKVFIQLEQSESNGKRMKVAGSCDDNDGSKAEVEASSAADNKPVEASTQPSEPPKQDYIHVRARRGSATDSYSLAERARREKISERMKILQDLVPGCNKARREKISERMKILQDLVPGCNKVTGKAVLLDEIINYIQSLQRQVELGAVSSRMGMKLGAVHHD